MFNHNLQGQVHFDHNGIRDVTELKVLQYRTAYLNGTPIYSEGSMTNTLMAIEVAKLGEKDRLGFLDGNGKEIWPSSYNTIVTSIPASDCFCPNVQVIFHMMV